MWERWNEIMENIMHISAEYRIWATSTVMMIHACNGSDIPNERLCCVTLQTHVEVWRQTCHPWLLISLIAPRRISRLFACNTPQNIKKGGFINKISSNFSYCWCEEETLSTAHPTDCFVHHLHHWTCLQMSPDNATLPFVVCQLNMCFQVWLVR